MTWLASTPAEVDMIRAKEMAVTRHDDAAGSRISYRAREIHDDLRKMHSVYRARNARAAAVARICNVLHTVEFTRALDGLIGDPAPPGGDRDAPAHPTVPAQEMMTTATLTLRQWAMITEALGVYTEKLRDDDRDNSAIADEVEQIEIPEGRWE